MWDHFDMNHYFTKFVLEHFEQNVVTDFMSQHISICL